MIADLSGSDESSFFERFDRSEGALVRDTRFGESYESVERAIMNCVRFRAAMMQQGDVHRVGAEFDRGLGGYSEGMLLQRKISDSNDILNDISRNRSSTCSTYKQQTSKIE